jgi:hypothetical protein
MYGELCLRTYAHANPIQLERFLRLIFALEKYPNNLMVDGNIREAIVNNGITRPSTSVSAITDNVCTTLMRYNDKG